MANRKKEVYKPKPMTEGKKKSYPGSASGVRYPIC